MEQQSLSVEKRTTLGKGHSRRFRMAGRLPGVLYGLGNNTPVVVDPKTIEKQLLSEAGRNAVFTVTGEGLDGKHVVIKDWQVEPLSRRLVHVDLLEIDINKKITVTVPISLVGKSAGVGEGGVLNILSRTVDVKCLPNAIPKHVDVDVTELKIGRSIHLAEIKLPTGVETAQGYNPTLVACVPPTKEEEAVAALAPTAEPEVITEKKAAEGEAAPAAGGEAKAGDAKKDEKKK